MMETRKLMALAPAFFLAITTAFLARAAEHCEANDVRDVCRCPHQWRDIEEAGEHPELFSPEEDGALWDAFFQCVDEALDRDRVVVEPLPPFPPEGGTFQHR